MPPEPEPMAGNRRTRQRTSGWFPNKRGKIMQAYALSWMSPCALATQHALTGTLRSLASVAIRALSVLCIVGHSSFVFVGIRVLKLLLSFEAWWLLKGVWGLKGHNQNIEHDQNIEHWEHGERVLWTCVMNMENHTRGCRWISLRLSMSTYTVGPWSKWEHKGWVYPPSEYKSLRGFDHRNPLTTIRGAPNCCNLS